MAIYIRLAETKDLAKIMNIITDAKKLLKNDGNPQWQNGRPNQAMINEDIIKKQAYCLINDSQIVGVAILQCGIEPTYQQIEGSWRITNAPYATIHRVAISSVFRGQQLGKILISNLISRGMLLGIHNFRIDTHASNLRMQGLIKATGFEYRGIIHVDSGQDGMRYAYELNL